MTEIRAVRDLVSFYIGGGWGQDTPFQQSQEVAIVRGADFPRVALGDARSLPLRWEEPQKARKRSLQVGDIVLEISGGTKERPTGRTVFISDSILRQNSVPTIPASFCRLIRPDPERVNPRFLYYWLQDMYVDGRTWGYQVQSTGLANFNIEWFLDRELVRLPPLNEQRRIAEVLGALDDLIDTNERLTNDLWSLCRAIFKQSSGKSTTRAILGEVAVHKAGKYLSKESYTLGGPFAVHGSNSLMGSYEDFSHEGPLSVLARIGSNCGAVAFSSRNVWINNNASGILARPGTDTLWLHCALESVEMGLHRAGSGQPFVSIESLMKDTIPCLDDAGTAEFSGVTAPLIAAADGLSSERELLGRTRDELLPLLMSGAVRVRPEGASA